MCVIKNCAVILAVVQFPTRGALSVLDWDAFGRDGGIVLRDLFTVPFVGGGGVVADEGQEGKGEGSGSDAAVDICEVNQLIVNVASQRRHQILRQPAVDVSVNCGQNLSDE